MIQVIKEADTDGNGTTSISEFLQIMRRIASEREITDTENDWQKLRAAKFSPHEVEETRQMYKMFQEGDVTTGQKFSRDEFQAVRDSFSDCEFFRKDQIIFFPEF